MRADPGFGEWYGPARHFEHPTTASLKVLGELFPDVLDAQWGLDAETASESVTAACPKSSTQTDRRTSSSGIGLHENGGNDISQERAKPTRKETGLTTLIYPSRNGETVEELHDRVARATEALIARCDAEGARAVLVCSHAAVVIAMGRVLTGRMPEDVGEQDFGAFTCGLSVYRRKVAGSRKTAKLDRRAMSKTTNSTTIATAIASGAKDVPCPTSPESMNGTYRDIVRTMI